MSHIYAEPDTVKNDILYIQDCAESTPNVQEVAMLFDMRDHEKLQVMLWHQNFVDIEEAGVVMYERTQDCVTIKIQFS